VSSILLDTGPLVALLNQRDEHHQWARATAAQLDPPFHTCEAVLAEAHFLISRLPQGNARLNDLVASGRMDLTFRYADYGPRVHQLMAKYADVPMSFADACLVALAETVREPVVLTLDSDFSIYRRKRNRQLRLLSPR